MLQTRSEEFRLDALKNQKEDIDEEISKNIKTTSEVMAEADKKKKELEEKEKFLKSEPIIPP